MKKIKLHGIISAAICLAMALSAYTNGGQNESNSSTDSSASSQIESAAATENTIEFSFDNFFY